MGYSPPPDVDMIEHKYRYEDYWNIIFQPTGNVIHPDADFPDNWAPGGKGFFQYGSLRRYVEDNSYGHHTIVPYRSWSASSGLLNTVTPDTSGNPDRAIVNWLTLDTNKTDTSLTVFDIPSIALEMAKDSLDVAWDSVNTVIIWYAGRIMGGYASQGQYTISGDTVVNYVISAERGATGRPGITVFNYPFVTFHEFFHAAFDADDLYFPGDGPYPGCSAVAHYSLMGDNSPQALFTPPMLDPWHKLRYGWLRYYVPDASLDTLNLSLPLDTIDFHLPIVEEPYNGDRPYVLAIPIQQHPDEVGWETNTMPLMQCIIVENRRAVGWDRVIAVGEDPDVPGYGDTTGTGGFLIWGILSDYRDFTPVWVYDADNDFATWDGAASMGNPGDLFDGSIGADVFSVWSSPGVFHRPYYIGMTYFEDSRNLYLKFPAYDDSSNVNPISRVVIDKFVPAEHAYGDSEDDEVSATQYSAQRKFEARDGVAFSTYHTGGKTFAMYGPAVDNQRHVSWLNDLAADRDAVFENSAITLNPDTSSPGRYTVTTVWQQSSPDGYDVGVRCAKDTLIDEIGLSTWGPYVKPPRPVIASRGQCAVIAFVADGGIAVGRSADGGRTWTDPWLLAGSGSGCRMPFVLMDSSASADSAYAVLYIDGNDHLQIFRSSQGSPSLVAGNGQQDCKNPTASRLYENLSVVYQYRDDKKKRNYVALKELDLSSSDLPKDSDAFGLKDQTEGDVNRDPVVLHTDSSDADKSVLYWVFNSGESLLFASRPASTAATVYEGVASSLSRPSMTYPYQTYPVSYPHLLYHEAGNPVFVVSRSAEYRGPTAPADTTPALIVMTTEEDLDANPSMLRLESELGMGFFDSGTRLMHVHMGTPVVVDGYDTIAIVQYDYYASKDFSSEPVDTLTRTTIFPMTDQDAAVFELAISCDQSASDTLVIESILFDPIAETPISSGGEIKLPPFTGDTVLTVGLELPNGSPATDCSISTSISRGYYSGGTVPAIELTRYMLFNDAPMPKRTARNRRSLPLAGGMEVYPQPARDELRFIIDEPGEATVSLHDMLGRKLREVRVSGGDMRTHGRMALAGIVPGMYMLLVRTEDDVRTGKVLVTK